MIPGPDYIYECPNSKCPNHLIQGSLASGNTFGQRIFSDGKNIAPMLTQFSTITKCQKCDTIFWMKDAKKIGEIDRYP